MRTTVLTDFFASPTPRLFAHRGDSGNYPENTLEAFQSASALGIPYLELDIHTTRDGAIVVIHDDDLRRVRVRTG